MKTIKLKYVTIIDFIFLVILSGMSFLSGFPKQLITIFSLSFLFRLTFNYICSTNKLNITKELK